MLSSLSIPRSLPRNDERGSWHCSISPKLKSDHHRAYSHSFNAFPPPSPSSSDPILRRISRCRLPPTPPAPCCFFSSLFSQLPSPPIRITRLEFGSPVPVCHFGSPASVDLLIGVSFLDGPRSSCNSRKILLINKCDWDSHLIHFVNDFPFLLSSSMKLMSR